MLHSLGWKRAEDLVLGTLLLLAALPLMLFITIAIKLDSTGPVLFRQADWG
jgi:lipopolysaccharide/colanic/teichoic acid biosynthesis glycosyltransferase